MSASVDITLSDLAARLDQLVEAIAAPPQRFFGVANAASYADLSVESVRRLLASGKLKSYRPVRGKILIDKTELDALILGATTAPRVGRGRGRKTA